MADNRFLRKQIVLQRLRRMPVAVRAEARKAMDDEGRLLVDAIRPHVPVEEGELADSLEWHRNRRGDVIGVVVTEGYGQEGDPLLDKARAVEFGRAATSKSGAMEPQPHFFPTYRLTRRARRSRVMRRVRKVIRSIWGGK